MGGRRRRASVAGIAVTSPLRTVIDLSSRLGVDGTGKLVDELLRRRLLTIAELPRARVDAAAGAGPFGARPARSSSPPAATTYDAGESTLEARLRRVIRRKGFPSPVGQHWVRDGDFAVRLDFAYPDVKVYLEGDGFGFHRLRPTSTATSASATAWSTGAGSGCTSRGA